MKHPVKRHRRRLAARAAAWKATQENTLEGIATRILTGRGLGEELGAGRAPVKGILS